MDKPLILVVEDDEKSRRLLKDVFEHQGYAVMETDQAEIGLELIRKSRPRLVVMDIHLPGMSGLDALNVIRAEPAIAATPVIAVTASVMGNDRDRIRNAGFDAFEPKPINLKNLLSTVTKLVARD
jgi:two-component system, cell cycle response regulator DivK